MTSKEKIWFARQNDKCLMDRDYSQVIVWPGTSFSRKDEEDFQNMMIELFRLTAPLKIIGVISTNPDPDNSATGGRHDLIFLVHNRDVLKLATPLRLEMEMSWLEDVYGNGQKHLYPSWFDHKYPAGINS